MLVSALPVCLGALLVSTVSAVAIPADTPAPPAPPTDVNLTGPIEGKKGIKTATLSHFVIKVNETGDNFQLPAPRIITPPDSISKRDNNTDDNADDEDYTFHWSRDRINATNDSTIYALPVRTVDLRATLNHAILFANQQDQFQQLESRNVSSNNLTVIMTSVPTTPKNETADWWDFREISKVMLEDVSDEEGDLTTAFVGYVTDARGITTLEVVVIPNFIFIAHPSPPVSGPPNGTVVPDFDTAAPLLPANASATSSAADPAFTDPGKRSLSVRQTFNGVGIANSHQLAERIFKTPYGNMVRRGGVTQTVGFALVNIVQAALTTLQCNQHIAEWTAFEQLPSARSYGDHIFKFWTYNYRFTGSEMVQITNFILELMYKYTETKEAGTNAYYPSLQGRIVDAAGKLLAQYLIGEPVATPRLCEQFLIEQPDGGIWQVGCYLG